MLGVTGLAPAVTLDCRSCGKATSLPLVRAEKDLVCPSCGRVCAVLDGVLVLDQAPNEADYSEQFYELLAATEEKHFWFRVRKRTILNGLREALGDLAGHTVLDVGCGTGLVLHGMVRAGMRCAGLDMFMDGLRHASRRSDALLICDSAGMVPFRGQFDVVCLCDVIEHVDEDVELLRNAAAAARSGGLVLVTVPARQSLWTRVDEAWGHKRRYSRESLAETLRAAGLEPLFVRYFNALLHPIQVLQRRRLQGAKTASEDPVMVLTREALNPPPRILDRMLEWSSVADGLLARLNSPLGTSLIAVARRD